MYFTTVKKGGSSLVVQWLGLCVFTTKGTGWIPGQGTKNPQPTKRGQKLKKKKKKSKIVYFKEKN